MALAAESFMRTGTRGSPSWPGTRARGRIGSRLNKGVLDKITCRRGGPYVFKSLLCLKVALRVHGMPRHVAEIQPLQKLADAALMQVNMKFRGDAVTQVGTAPAHHAIRLEVRAALYPLGHLTPLGLGEARLAARAGELSARSASERSRASLPID